MNTLQRYIFFRIVTITLGSFFAVLAVVWVTQVLSRIDFATGSGQSMFAFLELVVFLTPQLAALVLPIAVVIGMVQVFTTMNGDSELAVMSASGASRGMIAKPVMIVAILAGLLVLASNNLVEPRANRALRDLLISARSDLLTNLIREGVFTKLDKDLTVYVDRRLPNNRLSGIMVSDARDAKLSLLYYAQSGAIGQSDDNDVMVMTNGEIQRKNLEDNTLSIIRFNSYAISLSQFSSAAGRVGYTPHELDTTDLLSPDPDDKNFKNYPGWIRGEFHRRMTDWLYAILFALVGLVAAGQTQSHRQARFNSFFIALSGSLVYRWAAYAVYTANRSNGDLWWLFYALPIGAIALGAIMYRFGLTIAVPDPLVRLVDRGFDAIRKFRIRAARARAV